MATSKSAEVIAAEAKSSLDEAIKLLTHMKKAVTLLNDIKEDLEAQGFGTDDEISGADVVDVMNDHYKRIKKVLKKLPT